MNELFSFFTYLLPQRDLARSGTELGHRTKNEVTTRTQHHTASHSNTLPCSTTTWYSSTMTHIPSRAQTLYLQRDTNTSSYKNPVHSSTWPPAKCWSILLFQQRILVSHPQFIFFALIVVPERRNLSSILV